MAFPMSRAQRRAAEAYMRQESAKWPEHLKLWPREEWPDGPMRNATHVLRVYRSRQFLVQVFAAEAPALARLSVNRTSISGDRWQQGITWDELQAVKDQAGFADHDAVEIFPRAADVVNVANMRHLWVLAAPLPFAWRDRNAGVNASPDAQPKGGA